jgi:nicotinamide-nucleotide amidase
MQRQGDVEMIAEILSTGDEVRSGAIIDTNAPHIAQALERAGLAVIRHGCVGDDVAVFSRMIREISIRADICVVTGGLGPTDDDITAVAAARAAGVPLCENEEALRMVEAFFEARQRPLNPYGRKMACLPTGSEVIKNRPGAAPGFILQCNQCRFYFLPGVPLEMEVMLEEEVIPHILRKSDQATIYYPVLTLSSFGVPESETNARLKDFGKLFPELILGYRALFPEVQIKIYGKGSDRQALSLQMEKAADWIQGIMGDSILSDTGAPMEAAVGQLLKAENATVAVAESCTGGLIASRLTDVAGSSDYFLFSGVTYSNAAKIKVLGVSPETLNTHGAVHEETAKQMAQGARQVAGATYGLSTTGIAGPDGGTPEKPVGMVCIGVASPRGVDGYRFHFPYADRLRNKQLFAEKAMDVLRRKLMEK